MCECAVLISSVGTSAADFVVKCGLEYLENKQKELIKGINSITAERGAGGGKPGEYRDLTNKKMNMETELKKVRAAIEWQKERLITNPI
jgi:hypothetical protein